MDVNSELEAARREIRSITEEIIRLAGKRLQLSRKISESKRRLKLPVEDPGVERQLRESVLWVSQASGLDPGHALRLLNLLLEGSIAAQREAMSKPRLSHMQLFAYAEEMREGGAKLIRLEVGEPELPPPQPVIDECTKSMKGGHIKYGTAKGSPELREAVAKMHRDQFGVDVSKEHVLITPGSRFAACLALSHLLGPGKGMVTFEPLWPAYKQCARWIGARPITIATRLEDGWTPDVERLNEVVDESAEVLVLNNPCNPTGRILDKASLRGILEVAKEKGLTVLSDEVYSAYAFKPLESLLQFQDCKQIVVSSFSKAFRMTGFRIGYLISTPETVSKLAEIQGLLLTNVPKFIQMAAIKAIECIDDVRKYSEMIRRRLAKAAEALRRLPVSFYEPDGGFYIFPRIDTAGFDCDEFVLKLLREKGVAVAPGTSFGDFPHYVRLSACQPEDALLDGIGKMGDLLR